MPKFPSVDSLVTKAGKGNSGFYKVGIEVGHMDKECKYR